MHWVLDSQCSSYSLTRESFLRLHYHFSFINSNYKTATSPTRWKRLTKMFSLKRFSVSRWHFIFGSQKVCLLAYWSTLVSYCEQTCQFPELYWVGWLYRITLIYQHISNSCCCWGRYLHLAIIEGSKVLCWW
jgi:hypothetical protein